MTVAALKQTKPMLVQSADDGLERQIQKGTQALLAQQRPDGHWV